VVGGLKSLASSKEMSSDVLARGMPNHYMDVRITVSTPSYSLLDQHMEMDVGASNSVVRSFTVTEKDIPSRLTIRCQSYSIVKRLKLSGELVRCDLAPPKFIPGAFVAPKPEKVCCPFAIREPTRARADAGGKSQAALGRRLVSNAFSSSSEEPRSSEGSASQASKPKPTAAKQPRSVSIRADVDVNALLLSFYAQMAPDKVADIPRVLNHFMTRDKHAGILLATLEDKYKVKFSPDGSFKPAAAP